MTYFCEYGCSAYEVCLSPVSITNKKRVKALLVANGGVKAVAGVDLIVVGQGEEFLADGVKELLAIAGWEVGSADSLAEKGIAGKDDRLILENQWYATPGMAWRWNDAEGEVNQIIRLVIAVEVVGRSGCHIGHIVMAGQAWQVIHWAGQPASFFFWNINWSLFKGITDGIQTHDVVVVGVGQKDCCDWLGQLF